MLDIAMVLMVIAMTVITVVYMAGCEALMRMDKTRDESRAA